MPDFPLDFVHVFQGKGCYFVTIRLLEVTQYTLYELEFHVTSWKCCVVIHEEYCTCSQISKSQRILCHSDIHNSYQLVKLFHLLTMNGGI